MTEEIQTPPPAPSHDAPAFHEPASRAFGNGLDWLKDAFDLFKAAPGPWIGIFLLYVIIVMVVGALPIVGFALPLLQTILLGGIMIAAHDQQESGTLEFATMFDGFKSNTMGLVLVGVIQLVAYLLMAILAFVVIAATIGVGALFGSAGQTEEAMAAGLGGGMLIGLLILLGLYVPVIMAFWFTPALVAIDGVDAVDSIKLSFQGCLYNVLPFLLWGLVMLVLFIAGAIPLLLGLLVVGPLYIISVYSAYRDIFRRHAA